MRQTRYLAGALLVALLASPAAAQFYGKNKIQFDRFDWEVYHSPHFDLYFYPEERMHLEKVASLAETAYLKVSSDLKHQIPFAIPLIFYKTHSEFEQTHLAGFVPEGVLAFAESVQNRMVFPLDLPVDDLQNLITHELTHIFEYSILYQGLNSPLLQIKGPPLWVFEGFSDFETGEWNPIDLMTVRDMAITDRLPTIQNDGEFKETPNLGRADYNIGHAIFEFIESRWGMEGIRQFWWSLKKGTIVGKSTMFADSLKIKPSDFDQDFKKYMRERFKDFRTKEIPVDYGRDLSPQGKLFSVFSIELSPSGDLAAVLTGNRADSELDLVLLSTKDGKVIRNLTKGYTTKYETIHAEFDPTGGDALAWSHDGDLIAFLARTGKRRSVFLIKVTSGKVQRRIPLEVDEATAPAFYPDGSALLIAGMKDGQADLFKLSLRDGSLSKMTDNRLVERSPTFSPDGKWLAFTVRLGKNDKIFVAPADNIQAAEQKTFGEWSDVTPSFSPDSKRLYYSSSVPDGIYNIFTLNIETGERQQWTDVLGGNFFPLRVPGDQERVMFTSYYRGNFGLYSYELKQPRKVLPIEAAQQTQAAEEYKPAVQHVLQPSGIHERDAFKLVFAGHPPVNVGVATDGTIFGGSALSLSDMVGDHSFTFTAYSIREFRSMIFTYTNLRHRLQYQVQGFSETSFFYVNTDYLFGSVLTSPRESIATETFRGGLFDFYYPLDLYRRFEFGGGLMFYKRDVNGALVRGTIPEDGPGRVTLFSKWYAPLSVSFTQETTRFKIYGPIAGNTFHIGFEWAPGDGKNFIDRRTAYVDARKYLRISNESLLATRAFAFKSTGKNPGIFYFGGNNQLRGVKYYRQIGTEGFFLNAELRFPFINLLSSPIGILGPLRGVLFIDLGYARLPAFVPEVQGKFSSSVGGFHLVDGESSFGGGLQFFIFNYPLHLEFVKRTDYQQIFHGTDVKFWLGYDF